MVSPFCTLGVYVYHITAFVISVLSSLVCICCNSQLVWLCLIEMSITESRSWEEAACMHVFRPMQPLRWVIYPDSRSKFLKCCIFRSCYYSYRLVYYRPSTSYWVEPTCEGLIKSTLSFLITSQSMSLALVFVTTAKTRLSHVLILNLVPY